MDSCCNPSRPHRRHAHHHFITLAQLRSRSGTPRGDPHLPLRIGHTPSSATPGAPLEVVPSSELGEVLGDDGALGE